MDQVRRVLLSHSERFAENLSILVHVYGFFRLLCVDVALLSFAIVTSFQIEFCLVQEDFRDTFRVVLASNLKSVVPVLLMLVHVDCFLGLVSFYELLFSLFNSVFILQMKSIL